MKTHRLSWQDVLCHISVLGSLIILATVNPTIAQVKSDSLPEVKVTSTRYKVPAISQPQQVTIIGAETLENTSARDVVSLLSMYGHAYLRSNGPGMAAGLTQRGFGTTSFQVIRDGFTLNQPMHGQVDLALISVSSLGVAELATSNTSSTFGSAAPGGSLLLGSHWKQGWALSHERGPWGYQESSGSFVTQKRRSTFLLNAGSTSSENNYAYVNPDHDTRLRRENSSYDRSWLQLGSWVNTGNYSLRTSVYAHSANREIPDPITFLGMEGLQDDEEIRLTTELTGPGNNPNWSFGAQLWQNKLLYNDVWLTDRSYNKVRGASLGIQYELTPTPWFDIVTAIGGETIGVETNNYDATKTRNSANGSVRSIVRAPYGLMIFPAVRIDAIEDIGAAVSPSIGINKPIIQNLIHLRSQWSYNFTAPTLNDQYWIYGGNPDLMPERAHKGDLGVHVQSLIGQTDIDWQTQAFITRASNGIVWQPGANGFWSPVNLQRMNGYGMEQSIKIVSKFNLVQLHTGSQVTWNRSFIPKARYDGDPAVGKQLRYTPEWMFRIQIGAMFKQVQLTSEVSHDAKRYSSEDHSSSSDPLPAHTIANFSAQVRIPFGSYEPSIRLSMINAFDTKYNMLMSYPMPGRHLLIGIKVKHK
jgi:vitamin B12 transporter